VTQERIRELTKTMLRKKLYVVLSKGGAAPEKIAEHLPRHLEYMIGLEKKGVLFASGPLAEADGKMRGDGLTIVRAASAQAARKIAEADPFVVHGLRSFELREWTVMEGSLGIKVNFFRPVARAGLSSSAGVRYERRMRAWKRSASSASARSDCRFPKT